MFEVAIEETFAAGHALRNYRGKCENVHGHNYRVQVTIEGAELDAIGLLVDFVDLKKAVRAVIDRMDHVWLNDMPPFDILNPSAENMAKFIYDEAARGMKETLRGAQTAPQITAVTVWETDVTSATFRPK